MDRIADQARKTVSTMGYQPGPIGGDGWSVVSTVPSARLSSSSHQFAFIVTGRLCNVQRVGTVPTAATGKMQIALADSAGTKSPTHLFEANVNDALPGDNGLPFSFLVTCGGGISDPTWGTAWPGSVDLQLIGRTFWNQDAMTYAVQFDILDLVWSWVDVAAIPSGDVKVTQTLNADPAVYVPSGISSTNETWLHFWNVGYAAGRTATTGVQCIPAFRVGYRTSPAVPVTFVTKVGNLIQTGGFALIPGRLGLGGGAPGPAGVAVEPQRTLGSFWVGVTDGNPMFMCADSTVQQAGATSHVLKRFATVSIRLDNLPGVRMYAQPAPYGTSLFSCDFASRYTSSQFLPVEVPGGDLTSEPWSLVTGIPLSTWGYSVWIDTSNGPHPWEPIGRDITLDPLAAVPSLSWGAHAIAAGAGPYRFLMRFVTEPGPVLSPPTQVQDIYAVTFFPVRDPDNSNPSIPDVGAAVAIVPGTEGLDASSLSVPPYSPDAEMDEPSTGPRVRLEGPTGYVRTWSVFLGPRRYFPLTWTGLTTAQRDTLLAFLRVNANFAITPNRDAKTAVGQVDLPSYNQLSGQTWSVSVTVAELVYRG
jgi:hypothetical protein